MNPVGKGYRGGCIGLAYGPVHRFDTIPKSPGILYHIPPMNGSLWLPVVVWAVVTLAVVTAAIALSRWLGQRLLELTHVILVVAANITVYKTFTVGPLLFTAGDMTYNSAYSLLDVIHRREGYGGAKRMILLTLFANIVVALFLWTASLIPVGPNDFLGKAFNTLFRMDLRVVASSMISFYLSSRLDAWVAHKVGIQERFVLAFVLSNLASTTLDVLVFNTLAFFRVLPLLSLFAGQFVIKQIVTISNFVFILYARWLDRRWGIRQPEAAAVR